MDKVNQQDEIIILAKPKHDHKQHSKYTIILLCMKPKLTQTAIAQISELDRNGSIEVVIMQAKKSCKCVRLGK
jgi:pyrroline-5-carboxylate reductase